MSSATDRFPMKKNNVFSWEFVAVKFLLLLLLCVFLEKPAGSIAGRLALQQEGFNFYSYDMKVHHVYAIAIGPRGPSSDERGVWVNQDGTFKIDRLPVGEYELKVHVPGFATSYESGIFVDEGKTTTLAHDVTMQLENPNVNIATNRRVFTTKEQPQFWINTTGCSNATVKLYKQDMLALLKGKTLKEYGFELNEDLSVYKPYAQESKQNPLQFFKRFVPDRTWTRQLQSDENDSAHEEFKLEKPLPPGDYFAVAEVSNVQKKTDWSVLTFSVTDVGLVVKQDAWKTVVRAIDLNTLRPQPNVDVSILDRNAPNSTLAEGMTAANGFVELNRKVSSGNSTIVLGTLGAQRAYGGLAFYGGDADSYETYFYTDRPVYRLGQTVYFKGIARARELEGFTNPGGNLKLTATVEDPDNNPIWNGKITTSAHGTFHGVFDVPKDSKTGAYQVTIKYPNGAEAYERFEVAEYRKPEYQVDVVPIENRQTTGSTIKARVRANYYFGAPVANAKVKYTIYSAPDWDTRYRLMDRPSYYDYFDGWDGDSGYDSGYNGDYVTEGVTTTDENGEALVEFATQKTTFNLDRPWDFERWDRRFKIEAEVTDISRLSVIGNGAVSVTNGDFELFVAPTRYIAKVGDNLSADISAMGYDHKPVANQPVHVMLYRRKYDRQKYTYVGLDKYDQVTVNTDAKGKAHVDFRTRPEFVSDDYDIVAYTEDGKHNTIADTAGIWVASDVSPYFLGASEAEKEPLTVKLDKEVYQPGDVAKVLVSAPLTGKEGVDAIVSVEGSKLYDYKVVPLNSTAQVVEVPLKLDYAPNVYVAVTLVGRKHQFYNQTQMVKISPTQKFLNVSVESDKQKYKPGDNATYTIKAQYADGKPAANTEVSLGIVDESIYAIRPDATPDIRRFFYSRRENMVTTMCSFPEEYSGGPNKIEPRVRKDFRDTAAWIPELVTDSNGIAKATIKLPDNLTTWRATVRGITMNTEVGWAIQKVVSTQDLIVRIALPRFFTQGDEGFVTAVVHNFTDKPQAVQLNLTTTPQLDVRDSLQQKIMVFPDKAQRYSWPVHVVNSGEAVIGCKAVGDTAGDAMETKLPVRPLGVPSFAAKSGVLLADDGLITLPVNIPPDATPGSVKYHLYLSSSSIGSIIGNFGSLIDYPYGCTEQTMSKLFPSVVAIRLNQTLGVPLDRKDKERFKDVYKQSMAKLDGYQHEDGGWGWWADDSSQVYLTALVLDGYKMLKDAGYAVPADRQSNGIKWLTKNTQEMFSQLTAPMHKADNWTDNEALIDLSRAEFVLGEYGQAMPPKMRSYVLANKNSLQPVALCYFTLAFDQSGQHEEAVELYNRLLDLGNKISSQFGDTLDWNPSAEMWAKLGYTNKRYYYYSYRYTDTETTALALQTIAKVDPDGTERMEAIKRAIFEARGKDGWDNTKTTGQVLRSIMMSELAARKNGDVTDFVAEVGIGDQKPQNVQFDKNSIFQKEQDLTFPVKGSAFKVSLHKHGSGRLYYSSLVTYYKQIKPGQFVAEKGMPDGLTLTREFFRLVPSKPDSNGNVHFTAQKLDDRKVKAGETILMKVYADLPVTVPYSILEAPLPSGAEVVENDSRAGAQEEGDDAKDAGYYWGDWWWTHQDVMDDHMAFFVDSLGRGKCEFHQMLRMEIPGKFQINPVNLEGMYTKAVRGYSQADEITVTE